MHCPQRCFRAKAIRKPSIRASRTAALEDARHPRLSETMLRPARATPGASRRAAARPTAQRERQPVEWLAWRGCAGARGSAYGPETSSTPQAPLRCAPAVRGSHRPERAGFGAQCSQADGRVILPGRCRGHDVQIRALAQTQEVAFSAIIWRRREAAELYSTWSDPTSYHPSGCRPSIASGMAGAPVRGSSSATRKRYSPGLRLSAI